MSELSYYAVSKEWDLRPIEFLNSTLQQSILDLIVSNFNDMIRLSGPVDVLSAINPYMKRTAYFCLNEAQKKSDVKGTGLEELFFIWYYSQTSVTLKKSAKIMDDSAIVTVSDCMFKHASPILCLALSHMCIDTICEAVNPDFECVFTHHLSNGDPFCRYIYKRKSKSNVDLEDEGNVVKSVPDLDLPAEELQGLRYWALVGILNSVTQTAVDLYGSDKALEILLTNAKRIGKQAGSSIKNHNPEERDVAAVGATIDKIGTLLNQNGESESSSSHLYSKNISSCPIQIYAPEVCRQIEAFTQTLCEAINPDLEFRYNTMMTKGAETCSWSLRQKEAGPRLDKMEPSRSYSQEPLEILRMRLAKGEISKHEYEELKTLLSS